MTVALHPAREESLSVDAGGLRWNLRRWTPAAAADALPLLLLHGTGAGVHSWRGLAPLLAETRPVIAVDLPGHADTAGRPAGGLALPAMAGAVRALLAALETTPSLAIGHSAGAAVAVRLALDGLAVRGIVGLSPALQPFPGIAAQIFPALARLLFVNPFAPQLLSAIARRPGEVGRFLARSTGSRLDEAGVEAYRRLFVRPTHVAGAIGMMASWDLDPIAAGLARLDTPLLLIHGSDDPAIPLAAVRRSAAAAPDARLEVLPGLGHLAHEERPERVAAAIRGFIAEVRA